MDSGVSGGRRAAPRAACRPALHSTGPRQHLPPQGQDCPGEHALEEAQVSRLRGTFKGDRRIILSFFFLLELILRGRGMQQWGDLCNKL